MAQGRNHSKSEKARGEDRAQAAPEVSIDKKDPLDADLHASLLPVPVAKTKEEQDVEYWKELYENLKTSPAGAAAFVTLCKSDPEFSKTCRVHLARAVMTIAESQAQQAQQEQRRRQAAAARQAVATAIQWLAGYAGLCTVGLLRRSKDAKQADLVRQHEPVLRDAANGSEPSGPVPQAVEPVVHAVPETSVSVSNQMALDLEANAGKYNPPYRRTAGQDRLWKAHQRKQERQQQQTGT